MAVRAKYLLDTSSAARMRLPSVLDILGPLIRAGFVGTCAPLDTEALYSARNLREYEEVRTNRRQSYEYLPTNDDHWQRALSAQHALAQSGRHRAVGIADLLTAVLAAEHGLIVLHHDSDFEIAAEVLPFEHRWVPARGAS